MEEGEEREYEEEVGEIDKYPTPKLSSILEDTTKVLTQAEAGECLHTLGKCDSGLGYAYLGLNASNKGLTDIRIIPTFKYVLYVDVSGNRLTTEALRVLSSMKYLLMLQADRNHVSSAELDPMPYLQVNHETLLTIFIIFTFIFLFMTLCKKFRKVLKLDKDREYYLSILLI